MTELKRILLVEDNEKDVELTLEALEENRLANEVIVTRDGEEALDYLYSRKKFAGRPAGNPAAVLLDLKMPKIDGLEVLKTIKSDPALKSIPVVMLTSSREESDLVKSYDLGVNSYVVKPVNFERFMESVKQIGIFWALINEPLPKPRNREKQRITSASRSMNKPVHILHLEDDPHDGELVRSLLESEGFEFYITRVQSKDGFSSALKKEKFDLIISDFSMPGFNGKAALSFARQLSPETPFVFLSGTIGEDAAVESLLEGATDYVLKTKISRFVPAVKRALRETENRKARALAEKELRESEERYRTIFEFSPLGIANLGVDGKFVRCNRALEKFLGYNQQDLHTKTFNDVSHLEDKLIGAESFQQLEKGGRDSFEIEKRYVRKNGDIVWAHVKAAAVRDAHGTFQNTVSIVEDITERKKAEEALQLQTSYFQQLFENSPAGIALLDAQDRVVNINTSFEKMFQHKLDEIRGMVIDNFIVSPEYAEEARKLTFDYHRGHSVHRETVRKRKDGRLIDVAFIGYPIVVKGERVGTYALYIDITERKKLELQFLRAQRMESIGTLAGGIAHDLNNALGPILIGVQVLRKQLTDDRKRAGPARKNDSSRR